MEWYFGKEVEDLVVPKDYEHAQMIPSPESWSQWGMTGFGSSFPRKNFDSNINMTHEELAFNGGKDFYTSINMADSSNERSKSNNSSMSQELYNNGGSLLWNDEVDFQQFAEEEARINRMDDIFLYMLNSMEESVLNDLEIPLLHHHHIWVSWFGFNRVCESQKKGRRTNTKFIRNRAVERDSEFEIDPEKARDALRKLDQQLDLISQKQANPVPKTKASSPYKGREEVTKDVPDTESFLPFAFFGLLVFTIVYNIVFIKIIKPSIDGPQGELAPVQSSIMKQILKDE